MATRTRAPSVPSGGSTIRFPESLSLKDLITIVSVAVSLTVAWGVFSTRIALLEKEVVILQAADASRGASIEKLQTQVRRLEGQQQDDALILDQAFMLMKRPPPIRRAEIQ